MTLVVTGAAGFIGSNLVKALNLRGDTDIIAVDDLTDGPKYRNLVDCDIADYLDKDDFLARLKAGDYTGKLRAILHQGACSDTMEHNGKYMMANNYQYTLDLFDWCQDHGVPLLYASSAAVYGAGRVFSESREHEAPLNVYGYSKFLFDQVVRRRFDQRRAQVVGFRYFNVYGPREQHKGRMASVAFHHFNQYLQTGKVKLFEGYDGYPNGGQMRDFVSVEDVVKVNLHFLDHPESSGIFNLGSGRRAWRHAHRRDRDRRPPRRDRSPRRSPLPPECGPDSGHWRRKRFSPKANAPRHRPPSAPRRGCVRLRPAH